MSAEMMQHLPENWVGLVAVTMFLLYVAAQLVEKFERIAKFLPGGTWWHERQKNKRNRRTEWVTEDNEVIRALQEQISSIAGDLASVRETVRAFRAWSTYDARWHHKVDVTNAKSETCLLPPHLDYFAFEELWLDNPVEASRLPV
ncbi:minor tail protein [Mycobacterium phage Noelle]|uniref:Minor tail protein n=1 Tax=Mycobacterium phage Noelle TaxID=2572317 RepID=A0A6B9L8M8_9CAUD|nr:minor tail protein [Mycobacterium phage Noelle]QHB38060.1 minor tail protein [Mycobacterium phage Noelle]